MRDGNVDEVELTPWLERAREGDAGAYGEIVVRLSSWLRARLRRTVRDEDELDDVVQDAFVRAWERLDQYDPSRPFPPWLGRIGVNLALDRIRRRAVRDEVDDTVLESIPIDPVALDAVDHGQILDLVDDALEDLPEGWALVLRLKAVEEMSTKEIAEALDIPLGTVLSRLSRARARLAAVLAAHDPDPSAREEERS